MTELCIVKDIVLNTKGEFCFVGVKEDLSNVFIKYNNLNSFNYFKKAILDNKRIYFHIINNKRGRFQVEGDPKDIRNIRPIIVLTQEQFFKEMV